MTQCHTGEFERWRLAVQRAISSLSALNTVPINIAVTELASVTPVLGSGLQSCPLTVCTELSWEAAGKIRYRFIEWFRLKRLSRSNPPAVGMDIFH